MQRPKGVINLSDIKKSSSPIFNNSSASIWEVQGRSRFICVEFHTKANALNADAMKVLEEAIDRLEADDYQGLVVYNEAMNFSAGADLNTMSYNCFKRLKNMRIVSISENKEIEKRISITPEIAKKYISNGFDIKNEWI